MNEKRTDPPQRAKPLSQPSKKPYARPQLVKHGSVETLTEQSTGGGPSNPNNNPVVFLKSSLPASVLA
jgi:hypothetical protein